MFFNFYILVALLFLFFSEFIPLACLFHSTVKLYPSIFESPYAIIWTVQIKYHVYRDKLQLRIHIIRAQLTS